MSPNYETYDREHMTIIQRDEELNLNENKKQHFPK